MTDILAERAARQGAGRSGRKAETNLAARLNGKAQPASGAMLGVKGDVKKDTAEHRLLLENKSTIKDSLSLKKEWLDKIYQEALEQGRTPALSIQFTDGAGNSDKRGRWIMVPESVFAEMADLDDYQHRM